MCVSRAVVDSLTDVIADLVDSVTELREQVKQMGTRHLTFEMAFMAGEAYGATSERQAMLGKSKPTGKERQTAKRQASHLTLA